MANLSTKTLRDQEEGRAEARRAEGYKEDKQERQK